jgi:drug/metabolite transporter (DMT)-like permease
LLIPVVGVSGSLLILGEGLTLNLVIALALILSAVGAVILPQRKPQPL